MRFLLHAVFAKSSRAFHKRAVYSGYQSKGDKNVQSNQKRLSALFAVVFCLAFMAGAVSGSAWYIALAEGSPQGTAPTGGQPPEGAPQGGMGTPPDGAPPDGQPGGMGFPPSGGAPGGFGGSGTVTNGTSANTIDQDGTISGETYTSTGDNENALRIDGAAVTLENVTVDKVSGESANTEDGDFYGQNAGLLALSGARVTISGATIQTAAKNGNAVFSYGEGTTVTIRDSAINTTANNSGGIHVTGGGTLYAYGLAVDTQGNSAAAIRSDRGGGTIVADGGSYTSHGTGSPAIYSTANITVKNAALTATNSEAIVVEGKNSIALENCALSGNMTGTYQNDGTENLHNVMLYQSMSGDADVGTSSFTATGGSITAGSGDMFYVTNTNSVIALTGVALTLANDTLLRVEGNSSSRGWGKAGANGGNLTFLADQQALHGNVVVDTISTLDFTLTNGSTFEGAMSIADNAAGGTAVAGNAVVHIGAGCTWTLTGDSMVTSLTNEGTIEYNGYTITLADGTVMK